MIPEDDSRAYSYSSVEPHSSRPMPELRFAITQQQKSFLRLLSTKLGMLWALCYKFVQTPITYSISEEMYNYYLKVYIL